MHRGLQPGNLPAVHRLAIVLVRLRQEQVPDGAERVDLELVVLVVVAVGIDEDLEVVVVEDDRSRASVSVAQTVRLAQLGADVEIVGRPTASSRASASRGRGLASPSMSTKSSVHGALGHAASSSGRQSTAATPRDTPRTLAGAAEPAERRCSEGETERVRERRSARFIACRRPRRRPSTARDSSRRRRRSKRPRRPRRAPSRSIE